VDRIRIVNVVALAFAVYGFAAWVYVALVALILPRTLPLQLTHLASWPRTDTFGEISFIVSFVAFITYMLTRRRDPAAQ
jgi:hypothetical protein